MARSYLISDQSLVDELADLAPRIAADLMASAQLGDDDCRQAADAWMRLALIFCDDLTEPVGG